MGQVHWGSEHCVFSLAERHHSETDGVRFFSRCVFDTNHFASVRVTKSRDVDAAFCSLVDHLHGCRNIDRAHFWFFHFNDKGSALAHATHVNVLSAHAVEGVFFCLKQAEQWIANEVLDALLVLQPRALTLLTTPSFAGTARPASLWDSTLKFLVPPIEVVSANVKFHCQR